MHTFTTLWMTNYRYSVTKNWLNVDNLGFIYLFENVKANNMNFKGVKKYIKKFETKILWKIYKMGYPVYITGFWVKIINYLEELHPLHKRAKTYFLQIIL